MTQKTITPKVMEDHYKGNGKHKEQKLKASTHRRILNFINEAVRPEDLVYEKMAMVHGEGGHMNHEDNPEELKMKKKTILDFDIAKEIIEFRDREYPLGFRNLKELLDVKIFDRRHLDILLHHFSDMMYGSWSTFAVDITRRAGGDASSQRRIAHPLPQCRLPTRSR